MGARQTALLARVGRIHKKRGQRASVRLFLAFAAWRNFLHGKKSRSNLSFFAIHSSADYIRR
jgi:hypothetical protein